MTGLVLVKDCFTGHSPGKLMCGVQVLDDDSSEPGNLIQSIKRNLPTIIPIVPLVIAVQLSKGPRWGDGWANTKVIWKKYREHPVFTGAPLPLEEEIGSDYTRPEDVPVQDGSNPFTPPTR